MKFFAADSRVLAFAAVTRALPQWQARYLIARIYNTELFYNGFARFRSRQNANAAQQAEPVRLSKRTQGLANLKSVFVYRTHLEQQRVSGCHSEVRVG